ncbi:MFS transporter [Acidisphaera sp. S103]|uniref:MFS transporter n=1 Tax=Acidisphaera sp. S103 TaxID=1747223 RepID=UPI001C204D23|nr:MFS transporter [Acidisphaera sp. S103]
MAGNWIPPAGTADNIAATSWYREITPQSWRVLWFAGLGWMFDVYDSFVLSLTIPALIAAFALSNAEAGTIGSILAAGLIVGGIVMGWVADRIGRVRTLYLSILVYSLFTCLTAIAPSATWVAALRFLGGLGMGGTWTSGAALVAETWGAKHRGKGGALMQMGLPLGSMLAIGVTALITSLMGGLNHGGWRVIYGLGFLPALILLPVALRTPESPVWRARATSTGKSGSIADLFRGGNARGMLLAFSFIFFAQYIYWGVFTWTPTFLVSVKHLNFVRGLGFVLSQQFGSLIGFLVFAALVDRLGRRPTFIGFLVIGAIAVGVLVLEADPRVLLATMFFTGFGITGIFAGMGPFTAEMMSNTASRGLAMGLAYNGGRIGGLIAPVLIGALATSAQGFAAGMATTIVAFILAIGVILICPETRGTEIR